MDIDVYAKLMPNITTIIVQLLSTLVLFIAFKAFLWGPVLEYFEKRADYIEGQMNDAKDAKQQAEVKLAESEEQARISAKEYSEIVEQAKVDANKVRDEIIAQAKLEASYKIKQAEKEIEAAKVEAQDQMKEEMVEIALAAASKLMEKDMNEAYNRTFVEEFIQEVNE